MKTIIDQDHYIQHWIHLFYQHVYTTQSDYEAIEFLKTHKATHLMLTWDDLLQLSDIHSFIMDNPNNDLMFQLTPLQVKSYKNGHPYFVPIFQGTPFNLIDIDQKPGDNPPIITTAKLNDGSTLEFPNILFRDKIRIKSKKPTNENIAKTILLWIFTSPL